MYQNTFGGRAVPGPAGGAYFALLGLGWIKGRQKGRGGAERERVEKKRRGEGMEGRWKNEPVDEILRKLLLAEVETRDQKFITVLEGAADWRELNGTAAHYVVKWNWLGHVLRRTDDDMAKKH